MKKKLLDTQKAERKFKSYLKTVLQSLWVNLVERSFKSVSYELLNLREDVPVEVEVDVRLLGAYNFGEVLEAHLVAILEFAIVFCFLLDSVVGQMDKHVSHVVE